MTTSSPELQFCLLQSEQSSWNRPHDEVFNVAHRHVGRSAHSHAHEHALKSEDVCLEESCFKILKRIKTIRNNLVTTPCPRSNSSIRHSKVETKARSRSTSLQLPEEHLGRNFCLAVKPRFTFSSEKKHWCCVFCMSVLALFWSSEGFEII